MERAWESLYRTQDWALAHIRKAEHELYLTGGTALSRGYYNHRYSEDLDFFASDSRDFVLWRDRCVDAIQKGCADTKGYSSDVLLREERLGRIVVHGEADLKIEFVNDVPFRVGKPVRREDLGLLDTRENILANKISALVDRNMPKDIADVFWMCCRDDLDISDALTGTRGKAAGIFPPVVAKRLADATNAGVPEVFWVEPPPEDEFRDGLTALASELVRL
jgi:hypothetical protein